MFKKMRWVINNDDCCPVLHIQVKGKGEHKNRDYGRAIDIPINRLSTTKTLLEIWNNPTLMGSFNKQSLARTGRAYRAGALGGENGMLIAVMPCFSEEDLFHLPASAVLVTVPAAEDNEDLAFLKENSK